MSLCSVLDFILNNSHLLSNEYGKSYDEEFLKEVNKVSFYVKGFLNYFESKSPSVKEEKTETKSNIKHFISTLSEYLQLSEGVCEKIFEGYLLRENKVEDNEINALVTRGFHTKNLLHRIKKYYFDERLSLIRLMRYCFSDNSVEYKIIGEIVLGVTGFNTKEDLFKKILEDYEIVVKSIKNSSKHAFYNETEENKWMCALKEKIEILETLLIGTNAIKKPVNRDLFKQAFKAFKECNFGNIISARSNSVKNSHYTSYCEKICFLQSIILTELSDISSMFADDSTDNTHFMKDTELLSDLIHTVRRLISVGNHDDNHLASTPKLSFSRQCDSVMMVFVSLLNMRFPDTDSCINNKITSSFIMNLSQASIQNMSLFRYLKGLIANKPYLVTVNEGSLLGLCVYKAIFNLLSFFCLNVNLNSLERYVKDNLVDLFRALLTPLMTHTSASSEPLNKGFRKCLEDLSTSFPAEFSLIKVTSCLIQNDEVDSSIVDEMIGFLNNLSYFCEYFSPNRRVVKMHNLYPQLSTDETRTCSLLQPCFLYDNDDILQIHKDHLGYLVNDYVIWPLRFGVWNVIQGEVKIIAAKLKDIIRNGERYNPRYLNAEELKVTEERLEAILEFFIVAIKKKIELERALGYIQILIPLIDDPIFHGEKNMIDPEIFLGTMDCAVRLLVVCLEMADDGVLIRSLLSTQYLFPLTSLSSNRIFSNESLLKRIWRPSPSILAITIVRSYLKLCVTMIRLEKAIINNVNISELIPTSLLHGSIFFVTDQILPNLIRAGIDDTTIVTEIAIGCFLVLSEVLSTNIRLYSSKTPRTSKNASNQVDRHCSQVLLLQQLIIERLTQNDSSKESLRTILLISSIHNDVLLKQCQTIGQMLALSGFEERLAYGTRMALSLVDLICKFSWKNVPEEDYLDNSYDDLNTSCNYEGMASELLAQKTQVFVRPESSKLGAITIKKILYSDCLSNDMSKDPDASIASNYVSKLLSHLKYPFSMRLSRMSILVIRHLIEEECINTRAINEALSVYSSETSISDKINPNVTSLAACLACVSGDQVLRCHVIELLSMCLSRQPDLKTDCVPGVIKVIGSIINRSASVSKKIDKTDPAYIDAFYNWSKVVMEVLDPQFQIDDEICTSVMRSFSKLLLSLWVRECYGALNTLLKGNFWEVVTQIITRVINHLTEADTLDISLMEILTNFTGIVTIEFFAISPSTSKKTAESDTASKTVFPYVTGLIDPAGPDYLSSLLNLLDRKCLSKSGTFVNMNNYKIELKPDFKFHYTHLFGWWRSLLGFVISYETLINQKEEPPVIWKLEPKQEQMFLLKILAALSRASAYNLDVVADQLCDGFFVFLKAKYLKIDKDSAMSLIRALCQLLGNAPAQDQPDSSYNYIGPDLLSSSNVVKTRYCDLFVAFSLLVAQFNCEQFDEITLDSATKITVSYLQLLSAKPNAFNQSMSKTRDSLLLKVLQTAILLVPVQSQNLNQMPDDSTVFSLASLLNDRISNILQNRNHTISLQPDVIVITTLARYLILLNEANPLNGMLLIQTLTLTEKYPWKLNDNERFDVDGKLELIEVVYTPLLTSLVNLALTTRISNEMSMNFFKFNWPILYPIINDVLFGRIKKPNFSENIRFDKKLIDLTSKTVEFIAWKLMPMKAQWHLHMSYEVIEDICVLINKCMVFVTKLVIDKPENLFPYHMTYLSFRCNVVASISQLRKASPLKQKQVTFRNTALIASPKQLKIKSSDQPNNENKNNDSEDDEDVDQCIYVKLEMLLYKLFSNALCVYLKWVMTSKDYITVDWLYGSTAKHDHVVNPTNSKTKFNLWMILNITFKDDTKLISLADKIILEPQVSFGTLFSFLGATVHMVKDISPLEFTDPLTNTTKSFPMDTELMLEIHEQVCFLVTSQSLGFLIDMHPLYQLTRSGRADFILNLKSELNSYLNSLSIARRLRRLSSLVVTSPNKSRRLTSYSSSFESLGKFFLGLENFKKSIEQL